MDPRLQRMVVDRLDADAEIRAEVQYLVLAACEGDGALADVLGGATPAEAAVADVPEPVDPPAVYLEAIEVEGFRGIGARTRLALQPGAGLTVVAGRNGSGKSSFAEGLELCLTGANRRWEGRAVAWRGAWRNLHRPDPCDIRAEFCVDGRPEPLVASRRWPAGADLADGEIALRGAGGADLDGLGWTDALTAYRPFLSYNELGSMFEGRPIDFYKAMAGILGLDDIFGAVGRLRDARLARERAWRDVDEQVPALRAELGDMEDPRARACAAALDGRTRDLDAIDLVLEGLTEQGDPDGERKLLADLAHVGVNPVGATPADLRAAADARDAIAATDAGRARRLADLLARAVEEHEISGDGDCPVCGTGRLDSSWHAEANRQIARLRGEAAAADQADACARELTAAVHRAMDGLPAPLRRGDEAPVDTAGATAAWSTWIGARSQDDPRVLAAHLETALTPLQDALADVRARAAAELERRDDAWRPIAHRLRAWLEQARPARERRAAVALLRAAERWLAAVADDVRRERFAPIGEAARAHWQTLRRSSSVTLDDITLAGGATQRRVDIEVSVDGSQSAALGVMSQGELCSLALCMFLPRATLPESPFRFVVVDDPVQSMDPAKVDGLALVLAEVATDRQVVVFSHDDRLREAIRRLGIPARVLEVVRGAQSQVAVREMRDPVDALLEEAAAASRDEDLPAGVAARVVPGICRQAIEAACLEAVRRRRLEVGVPHADVDRELDGATGLYQRVALALFGDAGKESQGKVLGRLNNDRDAFGRRAADAFLACNAGAHGAHDGPLRDLVDDASRLARALAER